MLPLSGLSVHAQSWWYGCRFSMADAPADAVAHVILRRAYLDMHTTWTQPLNAWHPLPWAFPGDLADHQGLTLEVRFTCSGLITARLAFLTIPDIHAEDDFLFVSETGQSLAIWNTKLQTYATAITDTDPQRNMIYTVIPPMRRLIGPNGSRWDYTKVFRLQSWNDWVDM